jgi:hypothetical protein
VHELREHERVLVGRKTFMVCLRQSLLDQRLEIARFAVVASGTEANSLERKGRFERAEDARRKADRRLELSRRLSKALSLHRTEHGC